MGLLGDESVEFLLGDHTVLVEIGSLDHFLEDSVVGELTQILGNLAEVLESDETWVKEESTGLLTVEGDEDLVDFVACLVVGGAGGHHVEELGELDLSATVLVELGDHLIDCLGLGLDAEGIDGNLEF
jgi:hypothetical protein